MEKGRETNKDRERVGRCMTGRLASNGGGKCAEELEIAKAYANSGVWREEMKEAPGAWKRAENKGHDRSEKEKADEMQQRGGQIAGESNKERKGQEERYE